MTLSAKSFLFAHDPETGIAEITLNRPERLNALTFEVYRELTDMFRALDTEPNVRVISLTGSGRAFCSGGDVEDIIGELLGRNSEELWDFTRLTCDLIQSMRECRRPIVAVLNGTVAGAGAVMATAADFRVAAESAKIGFVFTKVGLSGADMGAAWLLPRIVGLGHATRMLMLGDFTEAEEAYRIGLYHKVVPQEELTEAADSYIRKLARGPTFALAVTKDALNREASMDLDTAMEAEAQAQAICMGNTNFNEAHAAFVEKRHPVFK